MEPEIDIYAALRKNRLITLSSIAGAVIVVISAIVFCWKIHVYQLNHALTLSNTGEVLPLKWIDRKVNLEIEVKSHIDLWLSRYYTYDQNNMERQRESGLWLIDADEGQKLEKYYKDTEWFNKVVLHSLRQKAKPLPETFRINVSQEPFSFSVTAIVEIAMGDTKEYWQKDISGNIVIVSQDYPRNPHGLLMYNYKESPSKRIENGEQF